MLSVFTTIANARPAAAGSRPTSGHVPDMRYPGAHDGEPRRWLNPCSNGENRNSDVQRQRKLSADFAAAGDSSEKMNDEDEVSEVLPSDVKDVFAVLTQKLKKLKIAVVQFKTVYVCIFLNCNF